MAAGNPPTRFFLFKNTLKLHTMKKQIDSQLLFLYQRYYFNKDMGDVQRANYWLGRIKEYELDNN
jgi:hypothetical protein